MNPGNGIETVTVSVRHIFQDRFLIYFLFMNPGNGIETQNLKLLVLSAASFLFMNPGNGIETFLCPSGFRTPSAFLIYESRQRD